MTNDYGVLLETGTNELEIVEFEVQGNKYGINVMKVKEIIQPMEITFVPHAHSHIEGIIQLRGEVLPVIDMAKVLGMAPSENQSVDKYIVTEFNQQKVVFHVQNVTRIHRISWNDIEKPSEMYQGGNNQIIGVIKMGENMILLIDFEKIVVDINPHSGIHIDQIKSLGERERSEKKIIVAEDSPLLRKLIHDTLQEAGYDRVEFFENGQLAYDYLEAELERENPFENVQLLVTDIEMPKMDGHHLTKRIKEHPVLKQLPVIIFSSLITDELRHKGTGVGADAQVSKPEIARLVQHIDKLAL
ncbi:chemotaxis protein [Domibacillus enclensis]|uniref:Chemotaxis protein CheV n=1 Tax=Domibacillus enclensis TaxID=1017273 RepID=A0A1N6U0P1_9BACI|nr:chemotaxis protein [Domibacillus enclensis]OXS78406.1 chemotaxis protein CheV [Domibacillus enclensis]SIQ59154.1 two-component system, chemotaxis family, response regulator CheV [Domibacillus enclensis]